MSIETISESTVTASDECTELQMSAACVAVTFCKDRERAAVGAMYSFYLNRVIPFEGLDQLVLILDDIMEAAGAPQASFARRGLKSNQTVPVFYDAAGEFGTDAGKCAPLSGKCMVLIQVLYRQHGSMQGILRSTYGKVSFRSALELMRMLYEYLGVSYAQLASAREQENEQEQ